MLLSGQINLFSVGKQGWIKWLPSALDKCSVNEEKYKEVLCEGRAGENAVS